MIRQCKRKMQRTIKQRYATKLCVGLGTESSTKMLRLIRQVFKDESMLHLQFLHGTSSSKMAERVWKTSPAPDDRRR